MYSRLSAFFFLIKKRKRKKKWKSYELLKCYKWTIVFRGIFAELFLWIQPHFTHYLFHSCATFIKPPPSALSSSSSSSLFFIFLIFLKPLHFPLLWPAVSGNTSRSQLYHYAGCDPCVSDREEAGVFKLRPSSEFLRTRVGVLVKPISEACEVLYPCVSRAMLTVKGLMDVKGHVQKKSKSVIFNWHQAKKKGGGTFCSPRQKRCRSTLK